MTYPQQPTGGHDPYGQPQYGQYDPAAQYGGGYGGGFAPPPPKKNTGAIVAVVAVVVLLLGGLGVTGFVAPGFFLAGDDDRPEQPAPTTTTSRTKTSTAEPAGPDGREVLSAVADGLDDQDEEALTELACADAKSAVDSAVDDVAAVEKAELGDIEEVGDDEVTGIVTVTSGMETGDFEVTAVLADDGWCWEDIEATKSEKPTEDGGTPTAGGEPVPADALAAMQAFLDSINAGDAATAKGMLCADVINDPAEVDELVSYQPNLAIDPSMDGVGGGQSVQLYLKGVVKGQELEGFATNLWVTNYDGPWCVHAFRAVVI